LARAAMSDWVRFATARGRKSGEIRIFDLKTRFSVGFDWVRFAGTGWFCALAWRATHRVISGHRIRAPLSTPK
jgi:hypothetical protein